MSEKPNRSRRSPKEKKRLSYERDRVNTYGENDKGSRKSIRRNKARAARNFRHNETLIAKKVALNEFDDRFDRDLAVRTSKRQRSGWRKIPDCPIGVLLDKRALKRQDGADRRRTRNVRDSVQAIMAIVSREEQRSYLWLKGVRRAWDDE